MADSEHEYQALERRVVPDTIRPLLVAFSNLILALYNQTRSRGGIDSVTTRITTTVLGIVFGVTFIAEESKEALST